MRWFIFVRMNVPDQPTESHADLFDAVIADYVKQVAAGAVPDRGALLARYADLADRLRRFFADHDRLGAPIGALHQAKDSDRTLGREDQADGPLRVRYFGDYELLEEIARGGMGVVYKARQISLNRIVALKMILQGELATPRDVARFRIEAEAAASLDHPHIVPIYEVGECDGRQYYAMRLIDGRSLAAQPRGDLRAAAALLATVTRAVHYAHQRGLLHRDIKPANILLDAQGQPHLTDFGLAKRVQAEANLSLSGTIVGTPSYMAPEQAAPRRGQPGDGGGLTTRADVYSLGAILFELLTGQPPFRADTPLDTLLLVVESEPQRPSSLNSQVDPDLETICLKCLQKEPGKRYASAEALADDLDRWLRGEPIVARPVGSLGRLLRWCRRNPTAAGLVATIAGALLAVTAMAIFIAIQANNHAHEAEIQAEAERAARQRAETAEHNLERETALSLLGPLDPKGADVLSQPEVEALWRLAATNNEGSRLHFFEEALRTDLTATQVRQRSEWVAISAVGLDQRRRARVEQLLLDALRNPEKSLRLRTEIGWVALELSDWKSPTHREAAEVIGRGLAAEEEQTQRGLWRDLLLARADRIAPGDAARLLNQMLAQEKDFNFRVQLVNAVAAAAQRLEPAEADRVCAEAAGLMNQAVKREEDLNLRWQLAATLAVLAERMEPAGAARVCAQAADQLNQTLAAEKVANPAGPAGNLFPQWFAAQEAVTGKLEPANAARVWTEAARLQNLALVRDKDVKSRYRSAANLAQVAGKLEPALAARVCGEAAGVLKQALAQEQDLTARWSLAAGLVAVAQGLEPAEATRLLNQAFAEDKDRIMANQLALGLAAAAGRLKPADAARACTAAVGTLTEALPKEKDVNARIQMTAALVALAGRLDPTDAWRILNQRLALENDRNARGYLLAGLVAAADGAEPAVAARLLTEALAHAKDDDIWMVGGPPGPGMPGGGPGLPPGAGPPGAPGFLPGRPILIQRLVAVAPNLKPADAARLLSQTLEQVKDANTRMTLAVALAAAERLEPKAAASVCAEPARLLNQALAQEKDSIARYQLANGLAAVAQRLEPDKAARVCAEAAGLLNQALAQESDFSNRYYLAQGIAGLAARLNTDEAARVCAEAAGVLSLALAQEKDINARNSLAGGLTAVAGRLEPADAARLLNQALEQEKDANTRGQLTAGLVETARRSPPAEANRLLSRAFVEEKDINARAQLVAALVEAANRLESAEAEVTCTEAARQCIKLFERDPDEAYRRTAAEHTANLLQPLDSEAATQAARVFARRIVADPNLFFYGDPVYGIVGVRVFHPDVLERFLTSFIVNVPRPQLRRRAVTIAATVGLFANGPEASLAFLPAAAEPLPCRLPTQDLVELLKMPTCTGGARRIILEQLGNRYGRRFETHWDFVRYADEKGLNLDFITPPERPAPKLPPLFEH